MQICQFYVISSLTRCREGLRAGVEGFWPAGKAALGQAAAQGQVKGVMSCLDTLQHMFTQSQPSPVSLPAASVFLLLTRILAFDDSPAHEGAAQPAPSRA